jgi:hypothetical protein
MYKKISTFSSALTSVTTVLCRPIQITGPSYPNLGKREVSLTTPQIIKAYDKNWTDYRPLLS